MNKIAYCLLASTTFLVFASCANNQNNAGAAKSPNKPAAVAGRCMFRIPLRVQCKDSGNYHDVSLWQRFLVEMGYLSPSGYSPGVFDYRIQLATEKFQTDFKVPYTIFGAVDKATFRVAEENGMGPCTPVNSPCP